MTRVLISRHADRWGWLCLGLVVLAALAGLVIKFWTLPLSAADPAIDQTPHRDAWVIDRAMRRAGGYGLGLDSITADGSYQVLGFGALGCPGGLLVVPLYRNAEGAVLLSTANEDASHRIAFAADGEVYSAFPILAPVRATLQRRFGYAAPVQAPVLAFRATEDCPLAQIAAGLTKLK